MNSVLDVNADSWEREVLQSKTLVLVDFWHENCVWCGKLDPIYNEVSEEYKDKVKFTKFNALKSDENKHIAYKYGVMGTPTLIFFCDGRPIEAILGFQPRDQLKKILDDVIAMYRDCLEKSTMLETS
jgi:thioredoxin 1